MAGATLTKLSEVLQAEVPYHEGPKNNETKYGAWYKFNFVAWCAIFLSWGCAKVGALYLGKPWRFASTISARDHAKKNNRWTTKPTVATIAMMAHTATTGHVGFVIALLIKDRILYTVTVEGNTNAQGSREGDQVAIRTRVASSWSGFIILDETYSNSIPEPTDPEEEDMKPYIVRAASGAVCLVMSDSMMWVATVETWDNLKKRFGDTIQIDDQTFEQMKLGLNSDCPADKKPA